jgi:hypothetical protein
LHQSLELHLVAASVLLVQYFVKTQEKKVSQTFLANLLEEFNLLKTHNDK